MRQGAWSILLLDFAVNSGKITGAYRLEVSLRRNLSAGGKLAMFCLVLAVFTGILDAQVEVAWTQTWDDPWNGDDRFGLVATDESSNVYVAGFAGGIDGSDRSFLVVKYTPDGSPVWDRTFNPTPAWDGACAMAVDRAHNVILAGYSNGPGVESGDLAVIKYSPAGDSLWAQVVNSGTGDRANGVVTDDSGNVYVTGELGAYPLLHCATIKFSPAGVEQWRDEYLATSRGQAIALDPQGGICVAGAGISSDWDIIAIKYTPSGETLWTARYDGPAQRSDISFAIAVDGSGNTCVGGLSAASDGTPDCVTIKLDAQGDTVWTQRYDGPAHGYDAVRAMALDHSGNVYVTGLSGGTGNNVSDFITIKYGPDGSWVWGARYDGPGHGSDQANGIALDGLGNTYVAGLALRSALNNDATTIRYDTVGRIRGTAPFNNGSSEAFSGVAVDPTNQVIAAGYSRSFGDDAVVIKYRQITGIEESVESPRFIRPQLVATLVRGCLLLPEAVSGERSGVSGLLDISGRKVLELHPGRNDVSHLGAGVFFVRFEPSAANHELPVLRRVIVAH